MSGFKRPACAGKQKVNSEYVGSGGVSDSKTNTTTTVGVSWDPILTKTVIIPPRSLNVPTTATAATVSDVAITLATMDANVDAKKREEKLIQKLKEATAEAKATVAKHKRKWSKMRVNPYARPVSEDEQQARRKQMRFPHGVMVSILAFDPNTQTRVTRTFPLYPQLVLYDDEKSLDKKLRFLKCYRDVMTLESKEFGIAWFLFCAEDHLSLNDVPIPKTVDEKSNATTEWKMTSLTNERVMRRIQELRTAQSKHTLPHRPINIRVFLLAVERLLLGRPVLPKELTEYADETVLRQRATGQCDVKTAYLETMETRAYRRYHDHHRKTMPVFCWLYATSRDREHSYWTDDEEEENLSSDPGFIAVDR